MSKKLMHASLIVLMVFLIQLPVRNAFGDPSGAQVSTLTEGVWVYDVERTLATAKTEQQTKALQSLKKLGAPMRPIWLKFSEDGTAKVQSERPNKASWWQDSDGQYHIEINGQKSLFQVEGNELTTQNGRNWLAVYRHSERSAVAALDSSVDDEYRKVFGAFIEEHGFKGIDQYDVKGVKLGMSQKEAINLLLKAGYVYTKKRVRISIRHSLKPIQFEKEDADKAHQIELLSYREPVSGAKIIAQIGYRQSFPASYNLDLAKAREQIVLKYGNPQVNHGTAERASVKYKTGHVILSFNLMKGSGHQKIDTVLQSAEFQRALRKVEKDHRQAKKAEAEQKKPSAQPEF